jgi:hypothetical protein
VITCVCGHSKQLHMHFRFVTDCAICYCHRYRTHFRRYRQWCEYRRVYAALIQERIDAGYRIGIYHERIFKLQARRESRVWPSKLGD